MSNKNFNDFIVKVNLHVVNHRKKVVNSMQILSFIFSIVTIAAIICYHGFYLTLQERNALITIVKVSLFFYTIKYFVLLFYSINKKKYLRNSWFEFLVIFALIILGISIYIFNLDVTQLIQLESFNYYLLFIQFYFLVIVLIELSKASPFLARVNISPPALMMLSFLFLLSIGTMLLLLPRMTTNGISFIDALFTSTSASCITGLAVLDTGTAFTLKGQIVILLLMQLGGMSILSFATFFTTFLSRSYTGLRYQYLVKDLLSTNKRSDSFILLRQIIITTFLIEIIGIALLYFYWQVNGVFSTKSENLFYSVFHAVSAFNNAGFSLWTDNLMEPSIAHVYFPRTVIMFLVFLGGIGFVTLQDIFNPRNIRERRKFKWKGLMPGTKIILYTTFFIIVIGTCCFLLLEYNRSLAEKDTFFEKVFSSLFQVVSSRTAGFNVVNMHTIAVPGLLIIILGMFIGASPGSTGGGIKTTTFFVLIKSVVATVRGKKNIEFQKKTIPFQLVDKAYSIIIMSLIIIFLSTFILAILEPEISLENLLFESVSAFSTAGLSTGYTSEFAWSSKLVLIFNMYIGRIGTLTIAYALSKRVKEAAHIYPETYFMVG